MLPEIRYGGLVFDVNFYVGCARFILQKTHQKNNQGRNDTGGIDGDYFLMLHKNLHKCCFGD